MHHITLEEAHHDAHLNEANEGFDHCAPLMIHCESEAEALEVARIVAEHVGDDHRLAGALPDEQPAPPPWADDDDGGDA